ncbi:YmdB family metallophosphoesterase [Actinoallomurus iriomotensis]|nr:YmdB family metallophosphoesterase [Actinoallomurus iriomotensis]
MNILFFGDVVGDVATNQIIENLAKMREQHQADLVIVNAENCAPSGLGQTTKQVEALLDTGVDLVTGGNHSWDSPDSVDALANPKVIRPLNLCEGVPGRGIAWLEHAGQTVTVLNLADACAMKSVRATAGKFRPAYTAWHEADRRGTVIVDYHGDHVLEKQIFARAVDGQAAAVLGTHTHEATSALHILPGGTALVSDVGMNGPDGGVQGFAYDGFVTGLTTVGDPFAPPLPAPLDGPIVIGAVLLEIEGGRTTRIRRITEWPSA